METYYLTETDIKELNVAYSLRGHYRLHVGVSPKARHQSEIRRLVHPDGVYRFKGQVVKWLTTSKFR